MKTKLIALFYICLCAVNISAQTYRFDLVDDKQDNYVAEINMLAKTVSLSKNGNALFSSTFYSTKKDWNSMVAFSFKQDQEPPMDLVSNQQYFIVLENSIQCNDPSQKNLYSLNAKSPSAYTAVYKELNGFLLGDDLKEKNLLDSDRYRVDAENGNAYAQVKLGRCCELGKGVPKDGKVAFDWYKKSADQGYSWGQYMLGLLYKEGRVVDKDDKQTVSWLEKSCNQGNAMAQIKLGDCFREGVGVDKDYSKAVELYRRSADQGQLDGVSALGWSYLQGHGVQKDEKKAIEWFEKAAEAGSVLAQHQLGTCYRNGVGVEKNPQEAVNWYKRAANNGDTQSKMALAFMLMNVKEVQNMQEGMKWLKEAAENGNHDAMNMLGNCYLEGRGIERNFAEAVKLYLKVADIYPYPNSCRCLGYCYFYGGNGLESNWAEAVKWFKKAIAMDENELYYISGELGYCYYYGGRGVTKDLTEAKKWFTLGAEKGNKDSLNYLNILRW